ncbi:hypothetical protein EON79_21580 [bacterium]|nr:MAG: hypothetical protein EON79_21580 [bacterium]
MSTTRKVVADVFRLRRNANLNASEVKSALEDGLNSKSRSAELSHDQLLAIAGGGPGQQTYTGHCITGPYTTQCGTSRTVCNSTCYTMAGTASWCTNPGC